MPVQPSLLAQYRASRPYSSHFSSFYWFSSLYVSIHLYPQGLHLEAPQLILRPWLLYSSFCVFKPPLHQSHQVRHLRYIWQLLQALSLPLQLAFFASLVKHFSLPLLSLHRALILVSVPTLVLPFSYATCSVYDC